MNMEPTDHPIEKDLIFYPSALFGFNVLILKNSSVWKLQKATNLEAVFQLGTWGTWRGIKLDANMYATILWDFL